MAWQMGDAHGPVNRALRHGGRAGITPAMLPPAPFVLLDDAREGGAVARLYSDPVAIVEAWHVADVAPALETVRTGVAAGRHAAGFLSYEAGAAFEPEGAPTRTSDTPLLWFGLFDGWREIADVAAWLPDPAGAWIGAADAQLSRDDYGAMFEAVQALIAAGDIYQANLTLRALVPFAGHAHAVYAKLRAASRAGWGALVETGTHTVLSLSPELFFALEAGTITCRPMKGTASRDADPARDAAAAQALATDEKQRAENLMIVDLMRNDVSRVAVPGSVAVPDLFAVERYPTVHQMTSTVTARLAAGRDALDVLAALFPCGSITGAPKVRAMQVIRSVEPDARGAYTGAIGRIDAGGDAQFNVAIRTLTIRPGATHAVMGIGGGIVADSRVEDEWAEAHVKAAFLTHGARVFDLIETMAFDPEAGIALLERHLDRMRTSAALFGFAFDRHDARNELQAATFRLRARARVRLLLAGSGVIAVDVAPMPATPARMRVAVVPLPVDRHDVRLRHKTSDRAFYDAARRTAATDEVVFVDPTGHLTEGSFTSLFVERGGVLLTPPLARGLLPGVLRAELIATARAIEAELTRADLATGVFVGNALRGLVPADVVAEADRSPL